MQTTTNLNGFKKAKKHMIVTLQEFTKAQVIEALPARHKFDGDTASRAYDHFVKLDLRYSVYQGYTFDNELGLKAEFSDKSDIPEYAGRNDIDILHDAFMSDINNFIACVKRG